MTKSWVSEKDFIVASQPDLRNPNIPLTAKNQKKITQVLSKNQKLASINQYEKTQMFEKKVNFGHEKQK